jgi:ABC-type branched-subunit amino acid transport system ATPase component
LGQQQIVEIAKALSQNVRILIMDEPTSALTAAETEALFRIIEDLKAHGVAPPQLLRVRAKVRSSLSALTAAQMWPSRSRPATFAQPCFSQ